jgi:hypothetical protein
MGRTLPSATQVLILEEAAFGKFRRALPRSDQLALDQLFIYAHLHIAEAQYASHTLPLEVFMLAMLLEEHREVMRMRKLIEELLNIHKSDIPESGSGSASQSTMPGFVDPGIGIDDNPNTGKGEE